MGCPPYIYCGSLKMLIETMIKLSSLVIDYLSSAGWDIIGYLYCDYRDQGDQTETNLLGSLLAQFLACQSLPKSTFEKILDICEAKQRKCEPLNLEMALEMILLVVQSPSVFICIDAMDELEQETQLSFLKSVAKVVHGSSGHHAPRLFLTGRPHIQTNVHKHLGVGEEALITITANEADIRRFMEIQIAESDSEAIDAKLKEEIMETIVAKSGGMYIISARIYPFGTDCSADTTIQVFTSSIAFKDGSRGTNHIQTTKGTPRSTRKVT